MNAKEKPFPPKTGRWSSVLFLSLAFSLTAGRSVSADTKTHSEERFLSRSDETSSSPETHASDYEFDYFRKQLSDKTAPETDSKETEAVSDSDSGAIETLFKTSVTAPFKSDASADLSSDSADSEPFSLLRTLKDYRELRSFPLPSLPPTIQTLETRLSDRIASYSGEWSVYVKNLSTGDTLILNDTPMKSASIMKLFIMGAVYDSMETGELERTREIESLMYNMICYSSNSDANQLLSLLGNGSYETGIEKVNQYIDENAFTGSTHEYNGFNDTSTILDSEHFNQVSAKDCGILLEQIYRRTFGSRAVCNEIEELMLNQDTRYKIPAGLPEGISVGNKTGEMDTVENDAAIIYGEKSDYILCILSSDWDSKNEAISHIAELSSAVYDFFDEDSYYQNTAQYRIKYGTDATNTEEQR